MSALAVNTPCYLVGLTEYQELSGRVVEIAGAPFIDDAGEWYPISGSWIDHLFPERDAVAQRTHLRPIIPPELAPPAARDREPEPVMNDSGLKTG